MYNIARIVLIIAVLVLVAVEAFLWYGRQPIPAGPLPTRAATVAEALATFCEPFLNPPGGRIAPLPQGPYFESQRDIEEAQQYTSDRMAEAGLSVPDLTDAMTEAGWTFSGRVFAKEADTGRVTVTFAGTGCAVFSRPATAGDAEMAAIEAWIERSVPGALRLLPGEKTIGMDVAGPDIAAWVGDSGLTVSVKAKSGQKKDTTAVHASFAHPDVVDRAREQLLRRRP